MVLSSHIGFNRVMVIDSCKIGAALTERILNENKFCCNILLFHNAQKALSYLSDNQHRLFMLPEVVFIDTNITEMSVFHFAKEFGKLSYVLTNTCRICITSSDDIEENDIAGLDDRNINSFIHKPMTAGSLKNILY